MPDFVASRIDQIRQEWGERLLILGHHYQHDSVLHHADKVGDSLELARFAKEEEAAERIVFCGVHFMAESARVLGTEQQKVYMPDVEAGCPMADMANLAQVKEAWDIIQGFGGGYLPVAYVNSSAEIKAFCGQHGGVTVTSGNSASVLKWAYAQNKKVFFLPDQHLGENSAQQLGISPDEIAIYHPNQSGGGLTAEDVRNSRMIVWKGFCIVHVAFKVKHIKQLRKHYPDAKIIVHPETPREVVELCDAQGSTAEIIRYVEQAPFGSTIVIGTEFNLVERLARRYAGRLTIVPFKPSVCADMARTTPAKLLDVLEHWPEANRVEVPEAIATDARIALERMLSL
jgi:quinolinate synthase